MCRVSALIHSLNEIHTLNFLLKDTAGEENETTWCGDKEKCLSFKKEKEKKKRKTCRAEGEQKVVDALSDVPSCCGSLKPWIVSVTFITIISCVDARVSGPSRAREAQFVPICEDVECPVWMCRLFWWTRPYLCQKYTISRAFSCYIPAVRLEAVDRTSSGRPGRYSCDSPDSDIRQKDVAALHTRCMWCVYVCMWCVCVTMLVSRLQSFLCFHSW